MSRQIITNKRLIIICGPTAVGKTSLAIQVAKQLNSPIISADSRQFYKEMNAATAKPSTEELSQAKHYFINTLSIHDEYSAGQFERDALILLDDLFKSNEDVVVVGGSGLYIRALVDGLDDFPEVDNHHIEDLHNTFQKNGIEALQQELLLKDGTYYDQVDKQNAHRLIRALSVIRQSGRTFSSFRKEKSANRPFHSVFIRLGMDREDLYHRIDVRVDSFIESGLITEAKNLFPFRSLKPLQTVGYTEMFDYIEGKIQLSEAIQKIKQHSRNYAKRQETWLRKYVGNPIFHPSETELILRHITSEIKE